MSGAQTNQELLERFAKQKGLATFDDDDAEPLLIPQPHHELIAHVEYCTAIRPSRTGSLRGSTQKYVDTYSQLDEVLAPLRGQGSLQLVANDRELARLQPDSMAKPTASQRPRTAASERAATVAGNGWAQPERPAAPLQPMWPDQLNATASASWPRLGAFEVWCYLRNRTSKTLYGPRLVCSKLQSGRWPQHSKIRSRFSALLQEMLKEDEKAFGLEKVTAPMLAATAAATAPRCVTV